MKGDELGMALCEAFGLDSLTVTRITLDIDAGSLPTVTVTFLPSVRDAAVIANEVRRYQLTSPPAPTLDRDPVADAMLAHLEAEP